MGTGMNNTLNKCKYRMLRKTSLMSQHIKRSNVCFKVNTWYKTNFLASNKSSISRLIRRKGIR